MRNAALMTATSLATMLFTLVPAHAQEVGASPTAEPANEDATDASPQPAADKVDTNDIIVTGSRLAASGLNAPTPVTILSSEALTNANPQSLAQGLTTIPGFRNSASPQSAGTGTSVGNSLGASYVNLRGLGAQRTLTLLDGRRMTPTSFLGTVDIALIPEGLVSRVEVVTGGASAAYGSDAVSGVVNFVLDKSYEGLKGSVQGGISQRSDNANYKAVLTAGTQLFGGRGHLLLNAEYYQNRGIPDYYGRDFAMDGYAIISVPGVTNANKSPTNPRQVIVPNVTVSFATYGGLITNTILRGTQFLPNNQTAPFAYGTLVGGSTMVGGDGVDAFRDIGLQPKQKRVNAFGRFQYDLTDNLTAYVQGIYGRDQVEFVSGPAGQAGSTGQFTIYRENAYLPQNIRDIMATNNIASFNMGRLGRDIGMVTYDNSNRTVQIDAGLTGDFGKTWSYEAYFSHGNNRNKADIYNQVIVTNLYRAADAVVNPATNQIACSSTLTNPNDGCVPINLFGEGTPSQAALDYVTGAALSIQTAKQDLIGFSVRGEALELPYGPLSVAFGGEYRWNSALQTADALSKTVVSNAGIRGMPASLVGRVGVFERQNPPEFSGKSRVGEAFLEVGVPVLADLPFARKLDLNGAIRYADYDVSGGVTTWKIGAVYEPFDGLRFRGSRSRDIRAPSLLERYLTPSGAGQGGPVTDPFTNTVSTNIQIIVAGNQALAPEKADTTSFGVVYRPSWLPRFGISVDYYKINIGNAISQLFASSPATNAQLLIDQCFAGNASLCDAIVRTNGSITAVRNTYFNIASVKASGVDFDIDYTVPLGGDTRLKLRGLASYLDELSSQLPGGLVIDRAGDNGQSGAGSPHWTGTAQATLETGPLTLFLQGRYIGSGKIDNTLTPSDININKVPSVVYADITARLKIETARRPAEFFFTINNLFDRDPPIVPRFLAFGTIPTNRNLYDVVGRQFVAGFRFEF